MLNLFEYNSLRFNLELSVGDVGNSERIKVFGWICCRADIFKLILYFNESLFHAPVGFPRPDVFKAINADRKYPFMNSYFCGIDSMFYLPAESLSRDSSLTGRLSMVDKKGLVLADMPFEFDSTCKISLHA